MHRSSTACTISPAVTTVRFTWLIYSDAAPIDSIGPLKRGKIMMKFCMAAGALCLALCAAPASATKYVYTLAGTLGPASRTGPNGAAFAAELGLVGGGTFSISATADDADDLDPFPDHAALPVSAYQFYLNGLLVASSTTTSVFNGLEIYNRPFGDEFYLSARKTGDLSPIAGLESLYFSMGIYLPPPTFSSDLLGTSFDPAGAGVFGNLQIGLETLPDSSSFAFAAADLSTVTLSINAVSEAPEPAIWASMLIGFGAIGGSMRRRRRATATA
jgi:hypothetical protein